MEIKIILINAMKYKDKETGQEKVRLGYIPFGKNALRNEEKFKGFTELGGYLDRVESLDEFDEKDFMKEAILHGEEISNPRNPFKKIMKLTQIDINGKIISLL